MLLSSFPSVAMTLILLVISTVCKSNAPIRDEALGTGHAGWQKPRTQVYDLCWKTQSLTLAFQSGKDICGLPLSTDHTISVSVNKYCFRED